MRTIVLVCLFAVAATAAVLPEGSYLPPEEKAASGEYLPPAEEVAEVNEAPEAPEESAALAEDGYRYKTVRRLKYRQRRDVSEIANEYLPPVEEPSNEYLPPAEVKEADEATEEPEESAVLAEDGYRYKTVRRLKYRKRRDVSELANEYLPPAEEVAELNEAEVTEAPEESAVLADDGYRYKTVRRLKYRRRRDVSELANEYLPPSEEPSNVYLPPAELKEADEATEAPEESAVLAEDGYRYKTVRRLKYRKRRDVSELVAPEYLPPTEEPSNEYLSPAEIKEAVEIPEAPEESAVLADDGYRYKTVRRLKYRRRRDVSELANEYLPPSEEPSNVYLPPAELKEADEATEAPEESAVLAEDGYRYKTVRRLKYRKRRDVSELANEYLPPAEEVAELNEAEVTEAPEESAVLADDGYRYKTVRRLKYRRRRDVSELANEYLPPAEEPSNVYLPPAELKEADEATEAPEESAVLAEDGYRYKTVRRLKYRKRRDVSELANEYLPPAEEVAELNEAEVTEAPEESAVLADDGYRYKTVRRLKYRRRRDVSELANEYLPPAEEVAELNEAEVTEAPEESAVLADDGYRYKTVRRLKYRKRRDVSELANEYLPPAEEVAELNESEVTEAPEESAVLADDGYRYKTVRRLKYRKRRDVSELANEYLPPAEEPSNVYLPPAELKEADEATEAPEESAVLAEDGYRYKTVRRLKYRKRRDVSELANEYLPPAEEVAELNEAEVTEAPEESAVLADDGYRYKTVRRLKYRRRRDVSELANEYLPPAEEVAELNEAEVTEAPEESAVLADDGYRYKTVRRLKYRRRRDVSELANEYLPPSEEPSNVYLPPAEVKEADEATEAPEESAVLGEDGYRYKTVRRLKYRKRRDVSEIIAPEYLPPVEKVANEYLPPAEEVAEVTEAPVEESAVLADDGYRYKTVKRIRYRN